MSIFFGIVNFGANSRRDIYGGDIFSDSGLYGGYDRVAKLEMGDAFFVQASLYNTPESHFEKYPISDGRYILVADVRLDNRDELSPLLELPKRSEETIGDGEYILSAYRKWGEECVERLLGDFAFAIWDMEEKRLFCARDYMGIRPLYHYRRGDIFIFCSDLRTLSSHPFVEKRVRERSVASFLISGQLNDRVKTFFENIYKLEGGTTLRVDRRGEKNRRYWHPAEVKCPDMPRDREDIVSTLRSLLIDAVKVRLRSDYPVASHLSGGLDSTPIAIIASREMRARKPGYRLPVYSWASLPDDDDEVSGEWRYPKIVSGSEDMDLRFCTLDTEDVYERMMEGDLYCDRASGLWYEKEIGDDLKRRGVRTMLSGWGGDEFVTNHGYSYYSEMLVSGRWMRLYKNLISRSARLHLNAVETAKFFFRYAMMPLFPERLHIFLPGARYHPFGSVPYREWFRPILDEVWRDRDPILSLRTAIGVRDDMVKEWRNGHVQSRILSWSQESIGRGYEYAYPLLDRRLVEFALHYRAEYMNEGGYDRRIYREAILPLIPDEIVWGANKNEEPKRVAEVLRITRELEKLADSRAVTPNRYRYGVFSDSGEYLLYRISALHLSIYLSGVGR